MPSSPIDYADVQGTILRGYRVDLGRHFILSVTNAAGARAFIASLVDGTGGMPRITTAARWKVKPECFLNIGFTCTGLAALGVAATDLATFDRAFQRGATAGESAKAVGDVGESAPANWIGGLADGSRVHIVLNLWVHEDPAVLEKVTVRLRTAFTGCLTELSAHDAHALPHNFVHFGYRDNIAQPTVDGAPQRKREVPDHQPVVATGEFLLGYQNEYGAQYSVTPAALSTNSSYAAFRILEQDVAGFEDFLTTYAAKAKVDPEMLAAMVCGRWRNGNPLTLAPEAPGPPLPMDALNDFTYVHTSDPQKDDTLGLRCPIGSHIRRTNPRNMLVTGGTDATHHRIIRRAMPYGPAYDPARPDSIPRGLIGYFINGSLTNQFEFLQGQWALTDEFVMSATGPGGFDAGNAVFNISGEDMFMGVHHPSSSFTIAQPGAAGANNRRITGFPRLITTRGGVYCFLPSITGLRYLAALKSP